MPGARCTRSLVCSVLVAHECRHHGRNGITWHSRTQRFLRTLPGDRALLSPSFEDMACPRPVGPTCLRKLDASVEASGPHDFAVRSKHLSSARRRWLTGNPPCHHVACPTLPRPSHPVPYVRDDRDTPLFRDGMARVLEVIWVRWQAKFRKFRNEGLSPAESASNLSLASGAKASRALPYSPVNPAFTGSLEPSSSRR
jgi:hypothetical protein